MNKHLYTSDRRLTTDQGEPPSTPSLLNHSICLGLLTEAGSLLGTVSSPHVPRRSEANVESGVCTFLELFPGVGEFCLGKQPSLGCISSYPQQRPSSSTTACFQAHSTGATFEVCNLFSHASAIGGWVGYSPTLVTVLIHQGRMLPHTM